MRSKNLKTIKKSSALNTRFQRFILPLVLIQFLAILILAFYARFTQTQLQELSTIKIGSLIINAVDGLTDEPNIDPQTGNIYIHEAQLMLPVQNDPGPKLLYRYTPADESGQGEEVRLIDKSYFNQAKVPMVNSQSIEQLFDALPKLQACNRGYQIQFVKRTETDIPLIFEKQLKDGRTIYVYLEDLCSQTKDTMVPYLLQIDSY